MFLVQLDQEVAETLFVASWQSADDGNDDLSHVEKQTNMQFPFFSPDEGEHGIVVSMLTLSPWLLAGFLNSAEGKSTPRWSYRMGS